MSWSKLGSWWLEELERDQAYEKVITPLLIEILKPGAGKTYLDLGSGEGRVGKILKSLGAGCFGVEGNEELAGRSQHEVVVAMLPEVPIRDSSVDGTIVVLTLEHIPDHGAVFAEAARVTKSGGLLVLVSNHPTWTAPGSTPITDLDGEVLWRPGDYFSYGVSEMPAKDGTVVFHHRTMADLLNAAAVSGWQLEEMVELPHHELTDQRGIPRLLGCRWRRY